MLYQSVLLKSEGRQSKDVCSITGVCIVSVNTWVARYNSKGIAGLQTKFSQGRKVILSQVEDKPAILAAIKANRQRIRAAKA